MRTALLERGIDLSRDRLRHGQRGPRATFGARGAGQWTIERGRLFPGSAASCCTETRLMPFHFSPTRQLLQRSRPGETLALTRGHLLALNNPLPAKAHPGGDSWEGCFNHAPPCWAAATLSEWTWTRL
jgi:hypothetical protein